MKAGRFEVQNTIKAANCSPLACSIRIPILAGLERLGVFLEPMPPVPPETDVEIRECLETLAFSRGVSKALSSLEAINRSFHEAVQISKLERYAPAQAELAKKQYKALKSADLPEPVISSRSIDTFTQRSESALLGWLEFLKRSQLLGIGDRRDKVDPDVHFSTLWYTDSVRSSRLEMGRCTNMT